MDKSYFAGRYQSYTNADLLKIVNAPGDYQPQALEAANELLANRNISEADIAAAQAHRVHQRQPQNAKWEKKVRSFLRKIYPSHKNITEKVIAISILVLCFIVVQEWYGQFDLLVFMFSDDLENLDLSVLILLPLIFLPVMTWWFYKRKKAGWTMVAIYLTFSIAANISMLIYEMNREPATLLSADILRPQADTVNYILSILFFGLFLLSICRGDVRKIYAVEKRYMFMTIGVTVVMTMLGILAFLM